MSQQVNFEIPGVPVPQPRQRHALLADGTVTNYTPKDHPVQAYKMTVRLAGKAAWGGPPTPHAVELSVTFLFPRPQRLVWKTRPMTRLPLTIKPDGDNLIKAVKDALTGVVWEDDAQVFSGAYVKLYCAGGEQPRTIVTAKVVPVG